MNDFYLLIFIIIIIIFFIFSLFVDDCAALRRLVRF